MEDEFDVLWVDDLVDERDPFITKASLKYNLNIVPVKCLSEALDCLEEDYSRWSALILDANCKDKIDDAPSLKFLTQAFSKLGALASKHGNRIPWFVYTGGDYAGIADLESRINDERLQWDAEWTKVYYSKATDSDCLLSRIQQIAAKSDDLLVKERFTRVFEVCSEHYIGTVAGCKLLKILKPLVFPKYEATFDSTTNYTDLRKVIEYLFRDCRRKGLLADAMFRKNGSKDEMNLTDSYLFLSGQMPHHVHCRCKVAHFPMIVSETVRNIIYITGAASHTTELEQADIRNFENYWNQVRSPYFLYGLTLQLCDVLIWYKQYCDEHPDVNANRALWDMGHDNYSSERSPRYLSRDSKHNERNSRNR